MARHFDFAISAWLIGLSFWVGTAYMRIQHNENIRAEDKQTRDRLEDRLNEISSQLSVIQGKLENFQP